MTQRQQDNALLTFGIVCIIIAGLAAWGDRERISKAYCEVENICWE